MREWSRSVVMLGVTFASVVAITLGLALLIVQDRLTSSAEPVGETPTPTVALDAVPARTGGSLTVSGDREGAFTLDHDSYDVILNPDFERGFAHVEYGRYGLLGEDGAIHFAHEPLEVEQIDFEGLAFYPEPDACRITPGELNPAIGVASARLECVDLEDIRDGGTVSIDGAVALPADMLSLRGDLPPPGGQVLVGDRTLAFSDGRMLVQNALTEDTGRQPLFLFGDDETSSIGFERDPDTGQLHVSYVVVDEELFELPEGGCQVSRTELGPLNPITTVVELSIHCDEVDAGSLGPVPIDASLVIDLIFAPDAFAARP